MIELWDIYDQDRRPTGQTARRGDALAPGAYHLVIHVCLFNPRGQLLIQQRQPWKEGWPNLWDVTVGGSALAGETSQQAAQRETLEEIGYPLDLTGVRPHLTVNFSRGFDDYYLVRGEVDLRQLRLQPEEVQQVQWASQQEVFQMLEAGEFIPYYRGLLDLLFEMGPRYSAHAR